MQGIQRFDRWKGYTNVKSMYISRTFIIRTAQQSFIKALFYFVLRDRFNVQIQHNLQNFNYKPNFWICISNERLINVGLLNFINFEPIVTAQYNFCLVNFLFIQQSNLYFVWNFRNQFTFIHLILFNPYLHMYSSLIRRGVWQ